MKFIWIVGLHLVLVGFACSVGTKRRIPVVNSYDPGPCEKKTHGKEVLVKNRADEENIVICVKDRGVYQWKSADGSQNTVGEFFNPGYDCSDILNKRRDAKDGFYWMTLKFSKPKKAWCDMITDGGGYILIGRKNNSITWSVPSNDIPVEPYGDPHWLSSLGDAQILDFRIQMATKEDFKYTVAHWSFRLQSTRPLKKLLITTDGCDQRSAGIGNIAYVKDLQTERVVTTTLRCSKFGFAHHSSSPFGWPKMNACLKKPCPWGFAYLVAGKYKHLLDYYGAFSYSTTGRISGMEYNATAFVGCDNQVCCACYGPLGGKKDYCTENCKAVNGGTVTKDIFSWFWIRSSLPKRLWKKCMEYELKRRDGKVIWYKLVGESIVPVEGRCSKDTALLHDGIVVVPNYTAAQKVPAIDGLLEYRKDKQELYVRSNKTWNAVAQKNKILKEIREKNMVNLGEVRKLEKGLESQKQLMNLTFIQLDKEIRNLRKSASAHFLDVLHKECTSYKVIENKDRNIKYGGGSLLCDSKISPGWYRFRGDAGTQMSTTCVKGSSSSNLKCSTHAVSWLNGAHPSVSEGKVTRKVCFSYDGNCCYWKKKTIEVINCGFFYVYKLSPPGSCHYRYCGTDM